MNVFIIGYIVNLFKTGSYWDRYWRGASANWGDEVKRWNHPKNYLISEFIKRSCPWETIAIFELGCGSCATMVNMLEVMKDRKIMLGGVDVNQGAVDYASKLFKDSHVRLGTFDDLFMSDGSVNIIVSDGAMMLRGPVAIHKVIKEIKRVSRKYVVLFEPHSTSWLKRFAFKLKWGYNMHNWKKLLNRHGFFNVEMYHIPSQQWLSGPMRDYAHLIIASIPPK